MSNWHAKYQQGQARPLPTERAPEFRVQSPDWDATTMGPPAAMQTRPKMNPGQCDTRTTDVFRTWSTDGGIPRHKHEVGRTMQSFCGVSTQDLPGHMQKFRDFLRLLELQVKAMLRGGGSSKDKNRTVYQQLTQLTMLPPNSFKTLLQHDYGIDLSTEDLNRLFERYGDPEMNCFDLQNFIQRMIRNEAAVGNWGGDQKTEADIYPGMSPALLSLNPTRAAQLGLPVQAAMEHEDSSKLSHLCKPVLIADGSFGDVNRLGGTALCPDIPKRPGNQRVKRAIQKSHLFALNTTFDSKLVGGYADGWAPPVGEGAWNVDPTVVGDGEKIGSHQGSRPVDLGMGATPDDLKNINHVEKPPYKLNSHNMLTSQSNTSPGIRVGDTVDDPDLYERPLTGYSGRPLTGMSSRPGTGLRPGTADPTGLIASKIASKLKQKHLDSQKANPSPNLVPSIRFPGSRSSRRSTKSCATNLNLLTSRMEQTSRSRKKTSRKFDPRNELFDLTQSTMKTSYRSQR